jgi:phytanoyl-CoA hydroxylase
MKGAAKAMTPRAVDRGGGVYPAELYAYRGTVTPLTGWDAVSDGALERYRRDGFLAIENAFSEMEVAAALRGLLRLIDGRDPDFHTIQFEGGRERAADSLTLDEKQDAVRKLMSFADRDPGLKHLRDHPGLMGVLTRLMGGKQPRISQEMALLKPPRGGREKPWHQDHAYFNLSLETQVVGVWIALDEATVENGCLFVLPGGHRSGPRTHFMKRDWQICDRELLDERHSNGPDALAVPLKPGGVLLFDGLLPHGTPANHSPHRRRAIQYHYRVAEAKTVPEAERLRIFGSEGKGVTC